MKTLFSLLVVVILFGFQNAFAQCTPIVFPGPALTVPDTSQGLPVAVETELYSQVIHVRIPFEYNFNGSVIPIDSAGIVSIAGAPTSITWVSNSATNSWPSDTFGCIIFQGTPTIGEAGNYTMEVVVNVYAFGTSLAYTLNYDFEVLDASFAGFTITNKTDFQVLQNQPNPFEENTQINYFVPQAGMVAFKVFDVAGNCVIDQQMSAQKGKNSFQVNGNKLSSGMYIYELDNGSSIIRKRMIVK